MNHRFRSTSIGVVSLGLYLLASSVGWGADDQPLIKTTHDYKTAGDVKMEADVPRPEIAWIS